MMSKRNLLVAFAAALASIFLTACGSFGSSGKNTDYRSQGGKIPSLEVPPDLTSPVVDDRFVIPDSKATTFSSYNRERGVVPTTGTAVLPKVDGARIERAGEQRWLVVKSAPDKAWPVIKEFWTETGFILKRETRKSASWKQIGLKTAQKYHLILFGAPSAVFWMVFMIRATAINFAQDWKLVWSREPRMCTLATVGWKRFTPI